MAKVEKEQTYTVAPDRCFDVLREVLSNLGIEIKTVDGGSRTVAGSFKGGTSKTDATERELPIRCICSPADNASTTVQLVYHNRGQMNRFVSADVPTKMESIFASLGQSLLGQKTPSAEHGAPAESAAQERLSKTMEQTSAYAAELYNNGLSDPQIESKLIQKALDARSVGAIMKDISALRGEATRKIGARNMAIGAVLFIIGVVVTVVTYTAAASGGGRYIVAWGAIIFGAGQFVVGLQQSKGKHGK